MGYAEVLRQREAKFAELEELTNRVKVLHGELRELHKAAIEGYPAGDRTFSPILNVAMTTERVKAALLASIGEDVVPRKTLVELAQGDTALITSLRQSYGDLWQEVNHGR